MTTTTNELTNGAAEHQLTQCGICGRHGWHTANRCPDLADVPVPPGARPDTWQHDSHRVLLGEVRGIDGVDTDLVCVQVTAIQHADGRIDDGMHEPPHVYLRDDALTATQARELAALLVEAADVIDGWLAP